MSAPVNTPEIDLTRRETAATEEARLYALLDAIKVLGPAREGWEAIANDDLVGDDGWAVLERLQELEGAALKLLLDPALADLLGCLVNQLKVIAEGQPCA